jgi:hypothetical protein
MKKQTTRLVISRETLRTLQTSETARAAGGTSAPDFCGTQANTCLCVSVRVCYPPLTTLPG